MGDTERDLKAELEEKNRRIAELEHLLGFRNAKQDQLVNVVSVNTVAPMAIEVVGRTENGDFILNPIAKNLSGDVFLKRSSKNKCDRGENFTAAVELCRLGVDYPGECSKYVSGTPFCKESHRVRWSKLNSGEQG